MFGLLSPCPSPRIRVNVCVHVDVLRLGARVCVRGKGKGRRRLQTTCDTAQGWRTNPSIFLCLFHLDVFTLPVPLMTSPWMRSRWTLLPTYLSFMSRGCGLTLPYKVFLVNLSLRPLLLRAANGDPINVLEFIDFSLTLSEITRTVTALVVPSLGPDVVLLDNSVMSDFEASLDWENQTMYDIFVHWVKHTRCPLSS